MPHDPTDRHQAHTPKVANSHTGSTALVYAPPWAAASHPPVQATVNVDHTQPGPGGAVSGPAMLQPRMPGDALPIHVMHVCTCPLFCLPEKSSMSSADSQLARRGSKAYRCGSGPEGAAAWLTASHLMHLPQHAVQLQCHPCMQAHILQHLRSSLDKNSTSDIIGCAVACSKQQITLQETGRLHLYGFIQRHQHELYIHLMPSIKPYMGRSTWVTSCWLAHHAGKLHCLVVPARLDGTVNWSWLQRSLA